MRITKELKKTFEESARNLVERYNPYIHRATRYNIGDKKMFIYAGEHLTEEEINKAYYETAVKDIQAGYEQRMVGYYDKWYRYSHADEGAAYDAGVKLATSNPKCKDTFTIIECNG